MCKNKQNKVVDMGIMERIMKEVGEKIKSIIKKRKKEFGKERYTYEAIGKYCGYEKGWLSNICNQGTNINVVDLIKVAEYLEVELIDLLPIPKKIDIEKMTIIDLVRYIINKEFTGYCNLCNLKKSLYKDKKNES